MEPHIEVVTSEFPGLVAIFFHEVVKYNERNLVMAQRVWRGTMLKFTKDAPLAAGSALLLPSLPHSLKLRYVLWL